MDRARAPGRPSRIVVWALLATAIAAVVGGMLAPYRSGPGVPLGADAPQHIWRMRLVASQGLDALPDLRGSHLLNANGDRPGLPVLASVVRSSGGPAGDQIAFVLPAVLAAVIALGAVAVARLALGGSAIATPLYALAAGASIPVAFAANGPYEQLLALALIVGAVAAMAAASEGRRTAAVAAALLLGGAWVCHWMVTLAGVSAMALALGTWVGIPRRDPQARTERRRAALRLVPVVAGAAVIATIATLLVPAFPQLPLGLDPSAIRENLARQLPAYASSLLAPLAVVGVVMLVRRPEGARTGPALLIGWASIPVVGVVAAIWVADLPLHRLLSVTLAPAILASAGAVGIARIVRGDGRPVRSIVSVVLAIGLVGALALQAWSVWDTRAPSTGEEVASRLAAIGRAFEGSDRPVVLVVADRPDPTGAVAEGFGTVPALRRIRAVMPAELITRTVVYLGSVDALLDGRPTTTGDPTFDAASLDAWQAVRPLMALDPVVLVFSPWDDSFAQEARRHPAWRSTAWLLSSEPGLQIPASPPALVAPGIGSLVIWCFQILGLLTVVGLGWSIALGGRDGLAVLGMAPGLGAALLVLAGLVVEAGFRTGRVGWVIALVVGGIGWFAAIKVRRSALPAAEPVTPGDATHHAAGYGR